MAAAEARTTWQRMANRCFVQEDAKRAPKFACCPSSAAKMENDYGNADSTNEKDHPTLNFAHLNWNPINLNLPLDAKWWHRMQPSFGYRECTGEELHLLEGKFEDKKKEVCDTAASESESKTDLGSDKNADTNTNLESPKTGSTILSRHNSEPNMEEMKAATSSPEFLKHKRKFHENWYESDCLKDWKTADPLISGKKDDGSFDIAPTWVSGEKTEPWWKVADREDLALFVAKKSLEHLDNCDLPRPQKKHMNKGAFPWFENFDDDGNLPSSFDSNWNADICFQSKHTAHSSSWSGERRHIFGRVENSFLDSSTPLSHDHRSTSSDVQDKNRETLPSSDRSKAELLEALCHSQTRAREAEVAAQKVYNEKEHVIKLFFRQASHLFAYKQWLQLLQLEKLYLQLKIKEEQDPSPHSPNFPWATANPDRPKGDRYKDEKKRGKEQQNPCSVCGFLVAFAVGFGLASTGLLLGWTFGCLWPV